MNKFIHLVTVRFHNSKLLLKQCCNTDEKASSNKIKPLIFTFSLNETLATGYILVPTAQQTCTVHEIKIKNQDS